MVLIHPYAMGRAEWLWNRAYEFNPKRHLIYNNENRKKPIKVTWPDMYKFPAFNTSPRYCLGKNVAILEAKVCGATLFANTIFIFLKAKQSKIKQNKTYQKNYYTIQTNKNTKVVLFNLLRKYKFTVLPNPKVEITLLPTAHMTNGMCVKIVKR